MKKIIVVIILFATILFNISAQKTTSHDYRNSFNVKIEMYNKTSPKKELEAVRLGIIHYLCNTEGYKKTESKEMYSIALINYTRIENNNDYEVALVVKITKTEEGKKTVKQNAMRYTLPKAETTNFVEESNPACKSIIEDNMIEDKNKLEAVIGGKWIASQIDWALFYMKYPPKT